MFKLRCQTQGNRLVVKLPFVKLYPVAVMFQGKEQKVIHSLYSNKLKVDRRKRQQLCEWATYTGYTV